MVRIQTLILLILIVMIPPITTYADSPDEPAVIDSDNTSVPVGILVMQSGFISDIGTECINAFNLVHPENPNFAIEQIIMDAGSDANIASSTWEKMKSTHPDLPVVITISSWTTNVVYPDASETGKVQLALGSASINRSQPVDRLITFTPGVIQETPVLASYLDQFSRIAIVGGENDYSRMYFTALNDLLPGKIVLNSRYNQDKVNETLNISEIRESNPDVIMLLSVSEGGRVAELLRTAGISAPLVGTRVIERKSLADVPAAEGLIYTTPELNRTHPFFKRYSESYGENATFFGAEAYDALNTLNMAIALSGDDPKGIHEWYVNRTYSGALGEVRFDETGTAVYPIGFRKVHNGTFEPF